MTRAPVLALALLLAGCAPTTPSIPATQEFLADREGRISRALIKAGVDPANTPKAKAARAQGREPGKIQVGDTQEYVRLQWGPPDDINTMLHAGGESVWWRWCSRYTATVTSTSTTAWSPRFTSDARLTGAGP